MNIHGKLADMCSYILLHVYCQRVGLLLFRKQLFLEFSRLIWFKLTEFDSLEQNQIQNQIRLN